MGTLVRAPEIHYNGATMLGEARVDVVILTTLALEYQEATRVDAGARPGSSWRHETFRKLPVAFREFEGRGDQPLRVAVAQATDMGAVAATGVLIPLVEAFDPRVIAMSGVCAGRPGKTALGDVVAAERLFFHDTGKQLPGRTLQDIESYSLRKDWKAALEHFDFAGRFRGETWWTERPQPKEWQELWVLAKLLQGAKDPTREDDFERACAQWTEVIDRLWKTGDVKPDSLQLMKKGRQRITAAFIKYANRLPDLSPDGKLMPFRVHVAPMGSGDKVLENPDVWAVVTEYMRKTLGLEMEAAALGALAEARKYLPDRLDVLVMKGVMDFAEHGRDDHFKEYAARASAECVLAFLRDRVDDICGRAFSRTHSGTMEEEPAPRAPNSRVREIFVGRSRELKAIANAILPAEGPPRPMAIVALQGMFGVGKSYLADRFFEEHSTSFPGGYKVLALAPGTAPDVDTLGGRLATLVRQNAWGSAAAWDELRLRLTLPTVLAHVENVDDESAAEHVVELARRLFGCALIISGRSRTFRDTSLFCVVKVEPLDPLAALQLLERDFHFQAALAATTTAQLLEHGLPYRAVLEDSRRPLPGTLAERQRLIDVLGYLPLALHLAAGHLADGHTIDGFLDALRLYGFALEPATVDDPVRQAGRARHLISTTFELSWDLLRARLGAHAKSWLPAFALMGHAPAKGVGRSLGATIAGLSETKFEILMIAATRLSLANQTAASRWSVHPLLAELLRLKVCDDAWLGRMTGWFCARLPETEHARWTEVHNETPALERWLELVPEADMVRVERRGSVFAIRTGPFRAWMDFCERMLAVHTDPTVCSGVLWTLCNVAKSAGAMERAWDAAETKRDIDCERGDEIQQALAWGALADILHARGDLDGALRIRQEEQLPVFERLGAVHAHAITHGEIADIFQARGDLDGALRIFQDELIPIFKRLGTDRDVAVALYRVANILQARGDLDGALRIFQDELIPAFERLGDIREQAVTRHRVAGILEARGDLDGALHILQDDLLPLFERLGAVRERAATLGKIANILQARGDLDGALRIFQHELLPVFERLSDIQSRASTLGNIASILRARGDLDGALHILQEELLPVFERLGNVHARAVTLGKVADILQVRGDFDGALHIRQNEEIPAYESLGAVRERALALGRIADILYARGDLDGALRIRQQEELPVYERLGAVRELAVTLGKVADILQTRGDLDGALRIRQQEELPVYERLGDVRMRAVTLGQVADILLARGDLDGALRIRQEEQLPVFERLGDIHSILVTRTNLAGTLLIRGSPGDREHAKSLLHLALQAAESMRIPEANTIRMILKRNGL